MSWGWQKMIIEPAWAPDDFESQYPPGLPTWIFKREKKDTEISYYFECFHYRHWPNFLNKYSIVAKYIRTFNMSPCVSNLNDIVLFLRFFLLSTILKKSILAAMSTSSSCFYELQRPLCISIIFSYTLPYWHLECFQLPTTTNTTMIISLWKFKINFSWVYVEENTC